jgi:hypothetical protein
MTLKTMLTAAALTATAAACDSANDPTPAGEISIAIQQSLTGQTTSAGTFTMSGAVTDDGQTTEELAFGGPLTQPTVPISFRRVLTGKKGTLTLKGTATLEWTSQTAGRLTGSWEVESASGIYSKGRGTLEGTANFAATPPSASIAYRGVINR